MSTGNAVSIDQLRRTVLAVLDHVQATYGDTIELESDYFWSVPEDAKFDVYTKPAELTVGQVSEVCEHLTRLGEPGRDVATFQLRWFAQLFEAIAHEKAV